MSSKSILLLCTIIMVAVLSAVVAEDVIFGQSAPFSGGVWEPGVRYDAGLLAAFKEVNDAGGVNGRTLKLVALDDQYVVSKMEANIAQLLATPNMFVFISMMGSPTVKAALPLAEAAGIPIVAPLTGSAVFRRQHSPYTIHLRAGYDDEAYAMLRLIINKMQYKRICMIYQDDSFGQPSKNIVVDSLASLGMELRGLHTYAASLASEDYTRRAQAILNDDCQAVIMYSTEGFSKPFFTEFYRLAPNSNIMFVTGSWNGDAITNHFRDNGFPHDKFYMTQVVPHPRSTTSRSAIKYRQAMLAYEGTGAMFDYLSIEGYLVGRLVAEIMHRVEHITRKEFMDAVYKTHLFEIDELLVGPYSNDCIHNQPATGRSSLCNCSQGLRFVGTTRLTPTYGYETAADDMVYSMTECYATAHGLVSRPALFGVPPTLNLSARALRAGLQSIAEMPSVDIIPLALSDPSYIDAATVNRTGIETYLLGTFGLVPSGPQGGYMSIQGLTNSHVHTDQLHAFQREHVFFLPTLEQEIYALAEASSGHSVKLCQGTDISSVFTMLSESLRTLHVSDLSYAEAPTVGSFTTSAQLSNCISSADTFHIVVGLESPAMLSEAVTTLATTATTSKVAFLFSELAASWDGLKNCTSADCISATERIRMSSNIPSWVSTESAFSSHFNTAVASKDAWIRTHPLAAVGYLTIRLIQFLMEQAEAPTGPFVLSTLYKFSVLTVDDVSLGPFEDTRCATDTEDFDCRCNVGPRTMHHYTISHILFGGNATRLKTQFNGCTVKYAPIETEPTDYTFVIVGVVVAVLVIIVAVVMTHNYLKRLRANKNAPKKAPLCLMFTDVEGDSALWEHYPDLMPRAIEIHHAIIRRLVAEYACYEVKTVGDAFMIAAPTIIDGTLLAMDIQQSLMEAEWPEGLDVGAIVGGEMNRDVWNGLRVRIGVHHAVEVTPKYDSVHQRYDYYGQDVNLTARVSSQAKGGHVYMTAGTFEILCKMPDYTTLLEGSIAHKVMAKEVELKGVAEPITMIGVLPTDLAPRMVDLASSFSNPAATSESGDGTQSTTSTNAAARSHQQTMLMVLEACPKEHQKEVVDFFTEVFNIAPSMPHRRKQVLVARQLAMKAQAATAQKEVQMESSRANASQPRAHLVANPQAGGTVSGDSTSPPAGGEG